MTFDDRTKPMGRLSTGLVDWLEVPNVELVAGITARSQTGEQMSSTLFMLEPGAVVPEHAHPNEEFGYVVEGHLTVWCEDEQFDVGPGGSFFVAANQPHRAIASAAGCRLLECYAPPRLPTPPTTGKP
jgi:quercetin dioxygenase-like cupin family protein